MADTSHGEMEDTYETVALPASRDDDNNQVIIGVCVTIEVLEVPVKLLADSLLTMVKVQMMAKQKAVMTIMTKCLLYMWTTWSQRTSRWLRT